jgi:acyl carrier protein
MNDDIPDKFSSVFRDVLGLQKLIENENYSLDSLKEWDSLAHVRLIIALEEEFEIEFEPEEAMALTTFTQLMDGVNRELDRRQDTKEI